MTESRTTSAPAVKLRTATHAKLQELSRVEQRAMGEIITALVDRYDDEQFWRRLHESVEALRADPVAWEDYQAEIRFFEGGSVDGLETEPPYFTRDEEDAIRARYDAT